jgi:PAS domain S-box-containing protein
MSTNGDVIQRRGYTGDGTSSFASGALAGGGHLQMQERLSHLIAKTTTDAFVAIDPESRVIYWNEGAEKTFGWRADEILGQSLHVIVPEIHRAGHTAGMRRLSEGHEPRLVGKMTNVPAIDRTGRALAIELSLTHWHDPLTGKPAGYAAIMRDVTERHSFEAERDAYQRKLEEQLAAMEATSDGIAMTDAEGFFVYLNPAHCTMFGYKDASELVGRHWSVLYTDEEAQLLTKVAIPTVLETGSWRGEARGVHLDGRVIEQEVVLAMSHSGGLVCTTRDAGERKQAMRERIRARERLLLAERQELISRAVSGVVHDFANFMAVISASAATLRNKNKSPSPELERIENAAIQANAMLELVFRPDRAMPADMALDAKSALATVVELTAVTMRPYHSIHLHAAEDGIAIKAAGTEFLRVMMNLCSNARDALPVHQAGAIEITLEKLHPERRLAKRMVGTIPKQPSAVITVTDTGRGIEEGYLARIFEPFQTDKSFGTGLGLAVVSAVVAEAGGSIHVRSGSHGTMFQIVWPLARTGVAGQEVKSDTSCPLLAGARILIVDDNPSVLDLIAAEVRKTAAEVTAVLGPVQALEAFESNPSGWDVVIVDYDMPEMNGAELAIHIRDRWPHLPMILCTALHEAEMSVSTVLFEDRVIKSAISSDLNHALARVLSNSKVRPS